MIPDAEQHVGGKKYHKFRIVIVSHKILTKYNTVVVSCNSLMCFSLDVQQSSGKCLMRRQFSTNRSFIQLSSRFSPCCKIIHQSTKFSLALLMTTNLVNSTRFRRATEQSNSSSEGNVSGSLRASTAANGLCERCNEAQRMKVDMLARFEPRDESFFDQEVEVYKAQLEQHYRLCPECEIHVHNVLYGTGNRMRT